MSDKDFKVKNKLQVKGITSAGPLVSDASGNLDSTPYIATQYGGTGTSTSPTAGQVLYSPSGTTYTATTFSSLPGVYARGNTASRPVSPTAGDLYYNTDNNYFEQYTSLGWFPVAAVPGTPTGVTATNQGSGRAFNNGQASIAFTTNTSAGYPSSFIVTPSPSTSPTTFTGTSSPVIVTGLQSSTQYTYTVQATSAYGTSSASSASSGVTATTVPQAPSISAVAGDTNATLTITAGATGGSAITLYTITSNPTTTTQTTANTSYTFTGLTNGTSYTFTATATNTNGTSSASSASNSIVPYTIATSYEPLASIIVPSGGLSTITFNSIPQTYSHLQLRVSGIAGAADCLMYFNNDTTNTNYYRHALYGNGASVIADYSNNPYTDEGSTSTTAPQVWIYDILDYTNTSKNTVAKGLVGQEYNSNNSSGRISLNSIFWNNTAAVNQITLSGRTWSQNSSFALYGIKG